MIEEDHKAPMKINSKPILPNFIETLKQLWVLPNSLRKIYLLVNEAFQPIFMDRSLFDVYGALHLNFKDSNLRVWNNIPNGFENVHPNQIERTSIDLWVQMVLFAAESEAPINNYSTASAEILRAYFPTLSAYMGRTLEEEKAFFENNDSSDETMSFCDTVWCRDESRHGPTLINLANRISGENIYREMTFPASPPGDFSDGHSVYEHIIARNSSEWHANALYIYLSAHANGPTKQWLTNVRADESRHLTVFASAYLYLYGPSYGKRIIDVIKFSSRLKRNHKKNNNHAQAMTAMNISTLLELFFAHFLIERKIQAYLKTVPLVTLKKIFEINFKSKNRPTTLVPQEKQNRIQQMIEAESQSRKLHARWPLKAQATVFHLKKYQEENEAEILEYINGHIALIKKNPIEQLLKIKKLPCKLEMKIILIDLTRDYQIMSHAMSASEHELKLTFNNLDEGFIILNQKDESLEDYACFCKAVTTREILLAVKNGHRDLESIQENTSACTGCGKCRQFILSLF